MSKRMYIHEPWVIDMYTYIYTYTYTHTHKHTYGNSYIHTYMHTYIHSHIYINVYMYLAKAFAPSNLAGKGDQNWYGIGSHWKHDPLRK